MFLRFVEILVVFLFQVVCLLRSLSGKSTTLTERMIILVIMLLLMLLIVIAVLALLIGVKLPLLALTGLRMVF